MSDDTAVRVWVRYAANLHPELARSAPDVLAALDALAVEIEQLRDENERLHKSLRKATYATDPVPAPGAAE